MAIQKNFVVKNGIEVNENLVFADKDANKVGIGTTVTSEKLQVNGGIGATSIVLSGVGTIPISFSNTSNISDAYIVSGVVTSITGTALTYTNADIGTLSADLGHVVSGVVTNLTGTISTFTTSDVTNLIADNGYIVSGIVTNLTGTIASIETAGIGTLSVDVGYIVSGIVTNLTGTAATIGTVEIVSGIVTNLTGTAATIGTVEIVSGIVTATSGVVTYYGDGTKLSLSGNPDLSSAGIGIATAGGALGYGITFLNLYGAGVSTSFYDSGVGIATIFFEGGGGGGGGAIGIGSTFPGTPLSIDPSPSNGDLFFHIDYARTFIYYDEVTLGVGSSAFWIDSSPFNIGIITAIYGGVAFSDGSAGSPSWYFEDDVTTGVFSPVNGELTFVSTGSSVLNINSSGINVTGVVTATSFVGNLTGTATGLSGTPDLNVGVVTATSFVGDGSGLTGAGSTVFNDTTTNQEFFPLFTDIISGTITASGISTSKLTYNPSSGEVTAVDFNSTSDFKLKTNIQTVENALEIVDKLRGVSFEWKENGNKSYGVIAQELEKVLPELVKGNDPKTVSYSGIIGVLIESVKELKKEVEDLKSSK